MSGVFADVLGLLESGASPSAAARKLGLAPDLAQAVADQAQRLGLVTAAAAACGTCVPKATAACAGCPLANLARTVVTPGGHL